MFQMTWLQHWSSVYQVEFWIQGTSMSTTVTDSLNNICRCTAC